MRCAEGLNIWQLSKYISPDTKWISSEINGACINAPDGTTVDVTAEMLRMEEPLGYIIERKIFDRDLARDAARAGLVRTHRNKRYNTLLVLRIRALITLVGAVPLLNRSDSSPEKKKIVKER